MLDPRWTVWRFYAYRVSVSNGFWLPVGTLYLQQVRGFGLGEIGLVMGAFSVAMVVAEVPTGYVGGRLGRRTSLLLGNVVLAGFMFAYTLVWSVEAYLVVHVVWAFGWAFRSDTADAWLYELLAAAGDDDQFARVWGRATTVEMLFEAGAALVAGVLVTAGWALPFVANGVVATLGIPLLLTTRSVDQGDATPGDTESAAPTADDDSLGVGDAVSLLGRQATRPEIRWLVCYSLLFSVLYQIGYTYEQPAMAAVGVSAAGLGGVYAAFKLLAAGAASTSGWLGDNLGQRAVLGLLVPVYGVAALLVAVVPLFVVPFFALNRSVMAAVGPIRNQYLNDRLADRGRATVLSGVSMVLILVGGGAKYAGGIVADAVGLHTFVVPGGVGLPALAGALWVAVTPVRKATGPSAGVDATPAD